MDYKTIGYEDCFQCVARHANELLELFSDHWLRFPQYQAAQKIIDRLDQAYQLYNNSDDAEWQSKADTIKIVQCALAYHAGITNYA